MTSQLIILGNGFDLHCGLKSSYKDFFRQEILDVTTENFDVIQLKPNVTGFWEKLLLEYHKKYGDVDYKWCDVESIIQKTLWSLFLEENNTTRRTLSIGGSALYYVKNNGVYLHPKIDLNNPIVKFLFDYCVQFFEEPLIKGCNYSDKEILNLLIESLLTQLHEFERRFCKYIKKNIVHSQKGLNTEYVINAINLLAKITSFSTKTVKKLGDIIGKKKTQLVEHVNQFESVTSWQYVNVLSNDFDQLKDTHILSFNYTALFDILIVESPCLYSNVHGKLCNKCCANDCNTSSIIFGIDDKLIQSHAANNDLRVFSKTYRKMFDTSLPQSVLPKNDESVDIKFYGHSLSEADYSYFQSIFDYYNLYGNNSVSLYFYYSENYDPTDAVYRLINEYGKTLTNKDQGKNLMHKLLLENRINIQKI